MRTKRKGVVPAVVFVVGVGGMRGGGGALEPAVVMVAGVVLAVVMVAGTAVQAAAAAGVGNLPRWGL